MEVELRILAAAKEHLQDLLVELCSLSKEYTGSDLHVLPKVRGDRSWLRLKSEAETETDTIILEKTRVLKV